MSEEYNNRRNGDAQIIQLSQKFDDFVERYERDTEFTKQSHLEMKAIIAGHDEFIRDIKPMYSKMMVAFGAFVLGSIGVGVNYLWKNIHFGK
jgi:hypothetical protein